MGSPNALILEGFEGRGKLLSECQQGDAIRVTTESGHTYYILVEDPPHGRVIVLSPDSTAVSKTPARYSLIGSTPSNQDRRRKAGWIGLDLCIEITPIVGVVGMSYTLSRTSDFVTLSKEEAAPIWDEARFLLE